MALLTPEQIAELNRRNDEEWERKEARRQERKAAREAETKRLRDENAALAQQLAEATKPPPPAPQPTPTVQAPAADGMPPRPNHPYGLSLSRPIPDDVQKYTDALEAKSKAKADEAMRRGRIC